MSWPLGCTSARRLPLLEFGGSHEASEVAGGRWAQHTAWHLRYRDWP